MNRPQGARVVPINIPIKLYNEIVDVADADNGQAAVEWIKRAIRGGVDDAERALRDGVDGGAS